MFVLMNQPYQTVCGFNQNLQCHIHIHIHHTVHSPILFYIACFRETFKITCWIQTEIKLETIEGDKFISCSKAIIVIRPTRYFPSQGERTKQNKIKEDSWKTNWKCVEACEWKRYEIKVEWVPSWVDGCSHPCAQGRFSPSSPCKSLVPTFLFV